LEKRVSDLKHNKSYDLIVHSEYIMDLLDHVSNDTKNIQAIAAHLDIEFVDTKAQHKAVKKGTNQ